jgi:hypothetical protein
MWLDHVVPDLGKMLDHVVLEHEHVVARRHITPDERGRAHIAHKLESLELRRAIKPRAPG